MLIILSSAMPIMGMSNKYDGKKSKEEEEGKEKGPHHSENEIINTTKSDETVKRFTKDYSQTEETASYSSDENEGEWYVEIENESPGPTESRDKIVAIADDETGEVKKVSKYIASKISEEDAIKEAEEERMGEFLEEHPDSEVWASYHSASGRWEVTAYDTESFERMKVFVNGKTGEIQTTAPPKVSWENALDIAIRQPIARDFLEQYAFSIDTKSEWEDGTLRNVEVSNGDLVLSGGSLGYTAKGSKRDRTYAQSPICGSWFTAPASGKIVGITAYAYYYGSTDYKAGIYRRSDGSLVAETESKYFWSNHTGWESFKFSSPVSVSEGTDYFVALWVCYSTPALRGIIGIYYDTDQQRGGYQVDTSGGTWPDSWTPTIGDKKYSIYAAYGYSSGRYTSEWYKLEESSLVRFTSKVTIDASDNHKITVNIQVSDDESTIKDNLLLNIDNGINTYDISTLERAGYVRINASLSTGNMVTTPAIRSLSVVTSSDLDISHENMAGRWKVSFVDETRASATVQIDATNGEVQDTRTFSWKKAIREFEEAMGELED